MWITSKGLAQESVVDPRTGMKKIVSVKVSGTGKKAEQEAFKRLEKKIEQMGDTRTLLSKLIEDYEKDMERSTKPSTQRKVSIELRMFLSIYGDCYIETINSGLIRQKLQASGKSNRTLNGYLKHFKAMWRWAYQNDYIKNTEVADKLKPFADTPEKERIQDKYLETEEITKLFDAMNNRRYLLLSRFLLLSGMRVGEAIALERSDISDSTIKISKTYDPNNNIVTAPKTFDSKREIFIQDELRACMYEIEDYVFHYGDGWLPPSNLFFPDGDGSYISYQAYSKYIRELSEKVLGRRVTPHIFRHTHVSILASVMSLDSIAARLGHADSKVTKDIYLHRTAELKERENQQLNQIHFIQ